MPEIAPVSQSVSKGWTGLSGGLWKEARAVFEQELEAGESAEALEGLSWAAWWLDDAETVFEARERAYHRYRKRPDPASAARMATWLAADHLDFHGALAVASGWLRRAGRLLEPLEPGPDHGWLAFHEGHIAGMSGDSVKAGELGARAAQLGRRFDVPDLEMLGLALQGASLVATAQVEEGMRCLDEATATALAGEATVPISSAWTCCFLVSACTAVLDYERAFEWCDRIAEFAERYGSRYMLAFCRAEYGTVHLWRGRWADAETLLEASIEDFSRSRPAWAEGPLVTLAELRRRQGRPAEVLRLLDQAGASAAAQLCRARLALDRDETLRAAELGQRVLRQLPEEAKLDRAPALELLVRARVARGELEEAASALAALREIERLVGTAPLRACTDLAEGVLAAAGGKHERPGRCWRMPWTASSEAAHPSRPPRYGSSSPRAWPRWVAPMRPSAKPSPRRIAWSSSGPTPRPSAHAGCSTARSGAAAMAHGWRGSRHASSRCWNSSPGAYEPADRRAAGGERAHGASPRHQPPAQARPPFADGRGRVRRPVGPTRRHRHVARAGELRPGP
jgi:LuxR family transcriptional regulator, maltose regulon positive regulatory protein